MVHVVDVHVVDGQDPIPDVQTSAPFGRRSGDDPANGGSCSGHGRNDDESETFVLVASHGHVIRIGFAR